MRPLKLWFYPSVVLAGAGSTAESTVDENIFYGRTLKFSGSGIPL
jgi:hypothetical protein